MKKLQKSSQPFAEFSNLLLLVNFERAARRQQTTQSGKKHRTLFRPIIKTLPYFRFFYINDGNNWEKVRLFFAAYV